VKNFEKEKTLEERKYADRIRTFPLNLPIFPDQINPENPPGSVRLYR